MSAVFPSADTQPKGQNWRFAASRIPVSVTISFAVVLLVSCLVHRTWPVHQL